jgi:hypothetical protein
LAFAQAGVLRLVTRLGRLSGSITVTIRIPAYCGWLMIAAIASMYWVLYWARPAGVSGISPLDASAAQSRPGRS